MRVGLFVVFSALGLAYATTNLRHLAALESYPAETAGAPVPKVKLRADAPALAKVSGATDLSRAVPNSPQDFRRLWEYERDTDDKFNKPFGGNQELNVLLAVPSLKSDGPHRNVIRDTWMKQHGVCNANLGQKKGCSVYVIFAYAHPSEKNQSQASDCIKADDCTSLEAKEGWTNLPAMTVALFRTLLQKFAWATHVGKLDMDTFPHLQQLLLSVPKGKYSIMGNMVDFHWCGGWPWCPLKGCGKPVYGIFTDYHYSLTTNPILMQKPCWSYPQGALYMFSRDLAVGVFGSKTTKGTVDSPDRPDTGLEDFMVGWAAIKYAWDSPNVTVYTWTQEVAEESKYMFEHLPERFSKAALEHKNHGENE